MKWQTSADRAPILPIRSLNHVSRVCRDVQSSVDFYTHVLGFIPIQRPSFQFDGAWLFNYGIGIHLIEGQPSPRSSQISPKADHLSFQSDSLDVVEERLNSRGIPFVKEAVVEHGLRITQIFLHDPDHNMVEICNCDCLPIRPLAPCAVLSSAQDIACPATPPAAEGGFASQRLVLANTAA
jgi:catechol 2,3-dioxygenase-like lactoylglutathione lyase family enzyme